MQSITNAAGGKCQRAHHIISARRRPAEREACQLFAAGRMSEGARIVKKKFLSSLLAARQAAGTALPSGRLAGGKELKKNKQKKKTEQTKQNRFFFVLFLLNIDLSRNNRQAATNSLRVRASSKTQRRREKQQQPGRGVGPSATQAVKFTDEHLRTRRARQRGSEEAGVPEATSS